MSRLSDRVWMERALAQARQAQDHDDVPVGAIVIRHGEAIAAAHNRREIDQDPTAHAELLAIRAAAHVLGSWRLDSCTMYVTLEPCTMCAGALVLARLPELVYGATDPKGGAVGSLYDITGDQRLNHRVEVTGGVMTDDCGQVLTRFFKAKRARDRASSRPMGATASVDRRGGVA